MKTSEKIDLIAAAFVKAQKAFQKAKKDKNNPFFKSKYADLMAYLDGSAPGLQDNELAIMQDTSGSVEGRIVCVQTILLHSSGQWIKSGKLVMHPVDDKPQTYGSTQTYCRRYSLASFLGLGAEDDDGNEGSKPQKPVQKQKKLEMPDPEKVCSAIEKCESIEEVNKLQGAFEKKYGVNIWDMPVPGEEQITWRDLFNDLTDHLN